MAAKLFHAITESFDPVLCARSKPKSKVEAPPQFAKSAMDDIYEAAQPVRGALLSEGAPMAAVPSEEQQRSMALVDLIKRAIAHREALLKEAESMCLPSATLAGVDVQPILAQEGRNLDRALGDEFEEEYDDADLRVDMTELLRGEEYDLSAGQAAPSARAADAAPVYAKMGSFLGLTPRAPPDVDEEEDIAPAPTADSLLSGVSAAADAPSAGSLLGQLPPGMPPAGMPPTGSRPPAGMPPSAIPATAAPGLTFSAVSSLPVAPSLGAKDEDVASFTYTYSEEEPAKAPATAAAPAAGAAKPAASAKSNRSYYEYYYEGDDAPAASPAAATPAGDYEYYEEDEPLTTATAASSSVPAMAALGPATAARPPPGMPPAAMMAPAVTDPASQSARDYAAMVRQGQDETGAEAKAAALLREAEQNFSQITAAPAPPAPPVPASYVPPAAPAFAPSAAASAAPAAAGVAAGDDYYEYYEDETPAAAAAATPAAAPAPTAGAGGADEYYEYYDDGPTNAK